jgi:hypothetical protein
LYSVLIDLPGARSVFARRAFGAKRGSGPEQESSLPPKPRRVALRITRASANLGDFALGQ